MCSLRCGWVYNICMQTSAPDNVAIVQLHITEGSALELERVLFSAAGSAEQAAETHTQQAGCGGDVPVRAQSRAQGGAGVGPHDVQRGRRPGPGG